MKAKTPKIPGLELLPNDPKNRDEILDELVRENVMTPEEADRLRTTSAKR